MSLLTSESRRRRRWVWGCTGGCLGFIVAAGALVAGFIWYLRCPQPVVPPETFVTPDTGAVLFVRVEPDNPLMVEAAVRLAMLRVVWEKVPTKEGRKLQMDAEAARDAVLRAAPLQVVVLLQPGQEPGRFDTGAVFSVHKFSRAYAMAVRGVIKRRAQDGTVSEHNGATVFVNGDGKVLAVRGNNYMTADREEIVTQWMARLEQQRAREERWPEGEQPVPELDADAPVRAAYERLDRKLPILFACVNSHGELAALLSLAPDGETRQALVAAGAASPNVVSVSGQIEGLDYPDAALRLYVECSDAGFAERLQEALEELVQAAGDASPLREIVVRRKDGALLRIDARIEDLPDKLSGLLRYLADRQQPPE